MKITSIEAFPVKARLKEPFVISNLNVSDLYSIVVKISTDVGIDGYGEAIPAWEVTGETQLGVIDIVHHFCEPQKSGVNLIGEDLSDFDAVKNVIDKLHPHNRPQAIALALSAMADWPIIPKPSATVRN